MSRMMSASSIDETSNSSSDVTEKTPSSLGLIQFGFHAKTSYDADEALLQTRSESFKVRTSQADRDIMKRPPPDFRYVMFDPSPPKRNTIDSMRPWEYGTIPGQREIIRRPRNEARLHSLFNRPEREPEIVTRFHIDRPFTAKKKFVTQGMYAPGFYDNPKPHDFRQYPTLKSLGLDEFLTDYEKDPYNIKFKSQRLNHIHGLPSEPPERDLVPGRQMAPPMSAKKHWDSGLIMEKTQWPQKNEAFTRHRRRHRQPYSAFLERVEQSLGAKWAKEKMDQALENGTS